MSLRFALWITAWEPPVPLAFIGFKLGMGVPW